MGANVQAAVKAEILGIDLVGMVSRTENAGAQEGQKERTMEFLIMPSSLEENEPITIDKVVAEINRTIYKIQNNVSELPEELPAFVTTDAIKSALSVVGLSNATLTFMQTFVHYKKVTQLEEQADGPANETELSKIMEYAIGIHIKGDNPKSDDFKFLSIEDVYINVWDTQNQHVLEKMQIWTPEQLTEK